MVGLGRFFSKFVEDIAVFIDKKEVNSIQQRKYNLEFQCVLRCFRENFGKSLLDYCGYNSPVFRRLFLFKEQD
jgi:hypothetical protein